jgi:hypothetical protein
MSIWNEPEPALIPYAGVRAGEIIGYRMWYVLDNNQLCSLAHEFIWEPNAIVEGKLDEVVENMYFSRSIYGGVYSYSDANYLTIELNNLRRSLTWLLYTWHGIAIGTIKCWGEVIEHEKGYRAQYAKLTSITDVIGPADITLLRRKYNV